MVSIASYADSHFSGVEALWNEAFPDDNAWNAAKTSIPEKLKVHPELLLIAVERGAVVGSIMGGYDGHRGWIYRAAVLKSYRGQGIGKALVEEVEKRLAALGCIKVNLQVVASNASVAGFYRSLGYQVEERVSMGKHLPEQGPNLRDRPLPKPDQAVKAGRGMD